MVRAVLDANVLVSWYAASSGTLFELMKHWRSGRFDLVVSEHILREVSQAWTKPQWRAHYSPEGIAETLALLLNDAELTEISNIVSGIASHPEDDLVLSTAVSANADYLVTGDKQLQSIGYYEGTTILSPRDFLTILEQVEG